MTENEALALAEKRMKAEHAAYMREWRKQNPDKDKSYREKKKQRIATQILEEVQANGK